MLFPHVFIFSQLLVNRCIINGFKLKIKKIKWVKFGKKLIRFFETSNMIYIGTFKTKLGIV